MSQNLHGRPCEFCDMITFFNFFTIHTMEFVDNTELDSQLILSEAVYNDSFVIFPDCHLNLMSLLARWIV